MLAFSAFLAVSPAASAKIPDAAQSASEKFGASTVTLAGSAVRPVLDGTAIRTGHYNPDQMLRLTFGLHVPHLAEEEQFLRELQTKGSPNFHKFLSAKEWNDRYAPSAEDEQKIVDWATSQGFTITHRFENRLLVDVEAPASVIEKALNITLNQYQYKDEVDFANDREARIPASLSGTLDSIAGLNSIYRFHRASSRHPMSKGPDYVPGPAYSAGPAAHGDGDPSKAPTKNPITGKTVKPSFTNGTYDPADVPYNSNSYDYQALFNQGHCCNPTGNSNGATAETSIALVTYGNFQDSDVQAFFNTYGMAYSYRSFYIDGSGFPGQDDEAPLDLEYSAGTANSFGSYLDTAQVTVYEATNNLYSTYEDTFNFIVSDGHARVVSTSYGNSEEGFINGNGTGILTTMHNIFNSMNGQGFTLIASAGDNGATDDCTNDQVNYPAADPDFIAAGGTTLSLYGDDTFYSETAWTGTQSSYKCSDNQGGGGGGFSQYQSAPSWQSFTGNSYRALPDISLNANVGQNYYYNGSLHGVGGTSIVAPELAGFFAQENAYLLSLGNICGAGASTCAPIGNAAPILYYEATGQGAPHYPFYDVTQGCNSNYYTTVDRAPYYCAGSGYDEATGWGSFNALQLAWAYNFYIIPADGVPSLSISGPATNTWYNTDQVVSWSVTDGVTASTAGLPAPGVAGFTQGWDSIPSDTYSEPHGGSGNSFYSGPQFPNGTGGCLSFNGAFGCAGNSGQGCHTVNVEAWDNQGFSTGIQTYGPICYDTVAPTSTASISPAAATSGWHTTLPVTVTLSASDPGGSNASGVFHEYYGSNASCTTASPGNCAFYSGPILFVSQGIYNLYSFAKDVAGNYSPVALNTLYIDSIAPVTTDSLSGTLGAGGSYYTTAVAVTLKATDNVSGVAKTYYSLDGATQKTYSSAFTVSALGKHTVTAHSVDFAGNIEATKTFTFTIDSSTTTNLTSSANPSISGHTITLTAKVAATSGSTPTGTVTFKDGSTTLGTGTLASGLATLATSKLPLGSNSLTAVYAGAGLDAPSTSAALTQTVQQTTTTTLGDSTGSTTFGATVKLTATVKASVSGTPTGTVTFYDGSTSLGSVTLSSGVAVLSTTKLTLGSNSVDAVYSGNSSDATSTSGKVSITITASPTTTTLAASPNPSTSGQSVTLTATVKATSGPTPTGTVTFKNGTAVLGTGTLSSGAATFSTKTLPVGSDELTAVYGGSTDDLTSTSAQVKQVVQ